MIIISIIINNNALYNNDNNSQQFQTFAFDWWIPSCLFHLLIYSVVLFKYIWIVCKSSILLIQLLLSSDCGDFCSTRVLVFKKITSLCHLLLLLISLMIFCLTLGKYMNFLELDNRLLNQINPQSELFFQKVCPSRPTLLIYSIKGSMRVAF